MVWKNVIGKRIMEQFGGGFEFLKFFIHRFFGLMTLYCICTHLKISYYRTWITVTNLQKYHNKRSDCLKVFRIHPVKG